MSTPVRLRVTGGTVHDPANGVDGEVRDVCMENGKIVPSLPAGAPTLDARGMVVMPGGVDIHSHFASSSCNHARRRFPTSTRQTQRPHRIWLTATPPRARVPAARCPAPSRPATVTPASATRPHSRPRWRRCSLVTRTASSTIPHAWMAGFMCSWGTTNISCDRSRQENRIVPETMRRGCFARPVHTRSRS